MTSRKEMLALAVILFVVLSVVAVMNKAEIPQEDNDVTAETEDNWIEITTCSTVDLSYTSLVFTIEDGNDLVIDFSGDEVVVTGATHESAKLFFEHMLKPYVDAYIEYERKE